MAGRSSMPLAWSRRQAARCGSSSRRTASARPTAWSRLRWSEAHEGKQADEKSTERDLGYEFSMPSPLRRMMSDLVGAVVQIAQTFDPNNTNPELSRALLTIVLGEGLEVQDPADLVDQVLPKGHIDPLLKMQMDQAKQQQEMQAGARLRDGAGSATERLERRPVPRRRRMATPTERR